MKDIFDFKRFGKYFLYDVRNAWNNYGTVLVFTVLLPVIFFFADAIFCLLAEGRLPDYPAGVTYTQRNAFAVAGLISILAFPSRCYGGITEKRGGSQWLLIPASSVEKTLSMVLMSCVVLPVVFVTGLCTVDLILTLLAPGIGHPLFSCLFYNPFGNELFGEWQPNVGRLPYVFFVNGVLVFLLGAICFRKSKVVKTILCCFAFSIVLSIVATAVFRCFHSLDNLEALLNIDREAFAGKLAAAVKILESLFISGLIIATYVRVRTIKH